MYYFTSFFLIFLTITAYEDGSSGSDEWCMVEDALPQLSCDDSDAYQGKMVTSKGSVFGNELNLGSVDRRTVIVALACSKSAQYVYMNAYPPVDKITIESSISSYNQSQKLSLWWTSLQGKSILEKQLFVFMPSSAPSIKSPSLGLKDWRGMTWSKLLGKAVDIESPHLVTYSVPSEKDGVDGIENIIVKSYFDGASIKCIQGKGLSNKVVWEKRIEFRPDTDDLT
jgi:hypothetical protein